MRLLIVEDEMRIATAIKRTLKAHNYAVDIVGDAGSGLAAAADPDYDLIILDRRLPGSLDGVQICRQIRSAEVHTPILMLTAIGEVDDRIEGLQAGADDYLAKPFAMKELVARVQVLLRRPPVSLGPVIKLEDLEVDTTRFEVKRAGKPIKLSAREFKLLTYLLYNQGRILTKDTIINHIWDGDTVIVSNTVEVYVAYLRKKIDKNFPGSPPLVQTVHGFGYKLGKTV